MTFPCFLNLVQLIEPNPIFYNNSCNPQRDPPIQIAVAVCCLGSNGNGSTILRLKHLFQVGFEMINLYTRRVIHAVYGLQTSLVTWPTESEQIESSQVMQEEGFPGCVGFLDGTTIPLSQKSPKDGQHYFDCKKKLAF
jgi:hypothetical protein